ncbi:hypothetical protein DL98DRAFT_511709 [Cadophora sp. DSE1049]|nr:hypothetical protein DL98DRAFT_511709 [Cadophora sp. DSE1049]
MPCKFEFWITALPPKSSSQLPNTSLCHPPYVPHEKYQSTSPCSHAHPSSQLPEHDSQHPPSQPSDLQYYINTVSLSSTPPELDHSGPSSPSPPNSPL